MSHLDDLKLIKLFLNKIKNSDVTIEMFEEYNVPIEEIYLIPIAFADLDVSARTDHGVIYLNNNLREKIEEIPHYLVHEITHYLQQTTGTKPTKGAGDGDYLENEYEQEGFQNQTEYISDTRGDDAAVEYVEKVLDHHDVKGKARKKRKEDLLNLASLVRR